MPTIISVSNLTKHFNDVRAVDDLSFSVNTGEVYGFLGQNGAGKSTTIRMLLTLIKPDSGSIEIFGMDLYKHRSQILSKIGAIIEKPDLYKYLTALDNLRIFASISGVKIPEQQLLSQLERVGLASRAHSKVKTYSQGMKQRLGIAIALVHDPMLIILDEPTNGLDPQGIADMRNLIIHLSNDLGKTVMVSSHLLAEIELIADSMLIIDKGKKVVEGNTTALLNPENVKLVLETNDNNKVLSMIDLTKWKTFYRNQYENTLVFEMPKLQIPELNQWLVSNEFKVYSLHARHTLEDYFLAVTRN